jgi:hypothetical protein
MKCGAKTMRRQDGSSIAEFGPVLFIFFVIVFFPLLGFFSFVDGVATIALAANAAARAAAPATTRKSAIEEMKNTGTQLIGGGGKKAPLAAFANLSPADNSGLTLQILVTNNDGSQNGTAIGATDDVPTVVPPDGGPPAIDTDTRYYQYRVTARYTVGPLFIPMQVPMEFNATSIVEHPEGLNSK